MRKGSSNPIGAGLLVSVILVSSCGSEPRVETPDPPGFRRLEAAGPFSVAIPQALSRLPVVGVDTAVDEFVGDGLRLGFSYGSYGALPLSTGLRDYATGEMTVDGRRGAWAAFTRTNDVSDGLPHGWVGHIGTPVRRGAPPGEPVGLTIYLSCRTEQICSLGPQVTGTVRFE